MSPAGSRSGALGSVAAASLKGVAIETVAIPASPSPMNCFRTALRVYHPVDSRSVKPWTATTETKTSTLAASRACSSQSTTTLTSADCPLLCQQLVHSKLKSRQDGPAVDHVVAAKDPRRRQRIVVVDLELLGVDDPNPVDTRPEIGFERVAELLSLLGAADDLDNQVRDNVPDVVRGHMATLRPPLARDESQVGTQVQSVRLGPSKLPIAGNLAKLSGAGESSQGLLELAKDSFLLPRPGNLGAGLQGRSQRIGQIENFGVSLGAELQRRSRRIGQIENCGISLGAGLQWRGRRIGHIENLG